MATFNFRCCEVIGLVALGAGASQTVHDTLSSAALGRPSPTIVTSSSSPTAPGIIQTHMQCCLPLCELFVPCATISASTYSLVSLGIAVAVTSIQENRRPLAWLPPPPHSSLVLGPVRLHNHPCVRAPSYNSECSATCLLVMLCPTSTVAHQLGKHRQQTNLCICMH